MALFKNLFWLKIGVIIWIIAGVFVFGCNKTSDGIEVDATITYSGSLATDGCDWLIETTNGNIYHADNLTDAFKINNLKVHISYSLPGTRFQCGLSPDNTYQTMQIQNIAKR